MNGFTRLGSHTSANYTLEQQISLQIGSLKKHTAVVAEIDNRKDSRITLNRYHVSMIQRWPCGAIKKKDCISISLAVIPSFVEGRALGKARKKSAVARRSSIRARCIPKQTIRISHIVDSTRGQYQETYSLIHHQMVKRPPSFLSLGFSTSRG